MTPRRRGPVRAKQQATTMITAGVEAFLHGYSRS